MTTGVPTDWKTPLPQLRTHRIAPDADPGLRLLWTFSAERVAELAAHLLAEGVEVAV